MFLLPMSTASCLVCCEGRTADGQTDRWTDGRGRTTASHIPHCSLPKRGGRRSGEAHDAPAAVGQLPHRRCGGLERNALDAALSHGWTDGRGRTDGIHVAPLLDCWNLESVAVVDILASPVSWAAV